MNQGKLYVRKASFLKGLFSNKWAKIRKKGRVRRN
jgi:hypothetical protein